MNDGQEALDRIKAAYEAQTNDWERTVLGLSQLDSEGAHVSISDEWLEAFEELTTADTQVGLAPAWGTTFITANVRG